MIDTRCILLVEDNQADAYLLQELFNVRNVPVRFELVTDGAAAVDYLMRRGKYANAARPDCIILDLGLPKKRGHEVLQEVRSSESLAKIPIVVLSTSESPGDRERSLALGANEFLTKPRDLRGFEDLVTRLSQVILPKYVDMEAAL